MSEDSEPDKSMWKEAAHHVCRLFKSVAADSRPRITLSKNLYFRIFSDKALLVSLGMDVINIRLSLDGLRTVLSSIHLASSSGQIQTVEIEGCLIKTDGRHRVQPRFFDEYPISWIWKPAQVASAAVPSTDYVQIDIERGFEHIREYVQRSRLELAYAEFAGSEAPRPK